MNIHKGGFHLFVFWQCHSLFSLCSRFLTPPLPSPPLSSPPLPSPPLPSLPLPYPPLSSPLPPSQIQAVLGGEEVMDDGSGLPDDPELLQATIEEVEEKVIVLQDAIAQEEGKMERYKAWQFHCTMVYCRLGFNCVVKQLRFWLFKVDCKFKDCDSRVLRTGHTCVIYTLRSNNCELREKSQFAIIKLCN